MDCKEINKYFFRYVEGEITEREKHLFEKHLESCKKCKGEYDFFKDVLSLQEKQKAQKMTDSDSESIVSALIEKKSVKIISFSSVLLRIAAVFILGLGIISGILSANKIYKTDKAIEEVFMDDFVSGTEINDPVYELTFYLNGNSN